MFIREYFGRRPIETNFSQIEMLLAEGQLKLCSPLTIFNREYFNWPWLSIKEKKKPLAKLPDKCICLDMQCLDYDEDEVKVNDEDAKEVGEVDVFVQRLRGLLGRATRH